MAPEDLEVVAPLVIDYLRFLTKDGGRSRDSLLSIPMTRSQQRLLRERLDDADYLWRVTRGASPRTRSTAKARAPAPAL